MKDNNFNFNQVFLNTIDSKQLLSFLHLNNISANISERSLSILLAKASFAFLLISMFSYWFQMSFNAQKLMNSPLGVRRKSFASHSNRALQISQIENLSHLQRADQKNKAITYNLYYFLEKVPFISMWSANITLALLLSIRWIESGHFPLSNLYESLLFLSWSLTVIHLFLENLFNFNKREQTLTLGAITSPVALFTNAFATFSLPHEMQKVTVLVPALKSNWLIMHVSVMIISYAALLSGSLLAMAFLVIKFIDDNSYKSSICTSTNLRLIRFARGSSASYSSGFNKSISSTSNSLNDSSNDSSSDSSNGSSMNSEEIILYPDRVNASARVVPYPIKSFLLYPEKVKGSWEFLGYSNQESEVEGSKPLLLKNLIKENKVLMDLPQILDNLSYRSIGLGFALLTIGILSGAVWANEAWGSYWSWDPKETWALITWLVFALYLHTRLSKGWVGKESAFVASFGFIVIWFCYLGVNLFGKGLHSYGWFQQ